MTSNKSSRKSNVYSNKEEQNVYRNEYSQKIRQLRNNKGSINKQSLNRQQKDKDKYKKKQTIKELNKDKQNKKGIAFEQESLQQDSDMDYSFNMSKRQISKKPNSNKEKEHKNKIQKVKLEQQNKILRQKIEFLSLCLKQKTYENKILHQKLILAQDQLLILSRNKKQLNQQLQRCEKNQLLFEQSFKNKIVERQQQFIKECQQQIIKLRSLVKELTDQKQKLQMKQTASQREQIKDRIIIKLQDQLITVKLLLQQQKQINKSNRKIFQNQPLLQLNTNINTKYNHSILSAKKNAYSFHN